MSFTITCPDLSETGGQTTYFLNDDIAGCIDLQTGSPAWIVEEISLFEYLLTPQFSQADYLLLSSSIIVFFATCWGINILGKSIYSR